MKELKVFTIVVILMGLIFFAQAGMNTAEERVLPIVYETILLDNAKANTTGSTFSAKTLSRIRIAVDGELGGGSKIVVQGRIYSGDWNTQGDTITAEGIFTYTDSLPLSDIRASLINFQAGDSATVRAIGTTF